MQLFAEMAAHWPLITGISLLGAVLALDETAFAQTWLSQPLPAGILAGLIAGDPAGGAMLGLPLQLATLGNLPVGQVFTGDRILPLLGAVAAAHLNGGLIWEKFSLGSPLSDPLPGWLLLAIVIGSLVGDRVVSWQRRFHSRILRNGLRNLKHGDIATLERSHQACLWLTAIRGLLGTVVWTAVLSLIWLPLLPLIPDSMLYALRMLPVLIPAVALGCMLDLRGMRSGLTWMTAGFLIVLVLKLIRGGIA